MDVEEANSDVPSEEDTVVRELDVYVTDNLPLYLLQFTLRPVYADSISIDAARFKPRHRKLELDMPFDLPASTTLEEDNDAKQSIMQQYLSSAVGQDTSLGAGIIKDNALYISPITSVLQLRPSFRNDSGAVKPETAEGVVADANDEPEQIEAPVDSDHSLQQVQLKRKETERAQYARMHSYAFVQSQEQQEPWTPLVISDIGSETSEAKFAQIHGNSDS